MIKLNRKKNFDLEIKIGHYKSEIVKLAKENKQIVAMEGFHRFALSYSDPSLIADGPTLAAEFLRSLPAAREEELVQYLLNDHPAEGEKLRKVCVIFQDMPTYPHEILKKVIVNFESEDIQRSLVGYDPGFVETFLSLLPIKKALMIQNDLFNMTEFPPVSQCAESRRKICQKIESEFEIRRFSLEEHRKNVAVGQ